MTLRRSSGSRRAPSAVDPTRSAKTMVSCRRSAPEAARRGGAGRAPRGEAFAGPVAGTSVRSAAVAAELLSRRVFGATRPARPGQSRSAIAAEPLPLSGDRATARADHAQPFEDAGRPGARCPRTKSQECAHGQCRLAPATGAMAGIVRVYGKNAHFLHNLLAALQTSGNLHILDACLTGRAMSGGLAQCSCRRVPKTSSAKPRRIRKS